MVRLRPGKSDLNVHLSGRGRAVVVLGPVVVALALPAAGCGGRTKSPSVASLQTTSASNTSGGASSSSSSVPPGGAGFGGDMSITVGTGTAGVKYASCMRSNGLSELTAVPEGAR